MNGSDNRPTSEVYNYYFYPDTSSSSGYSNTAGMIAGIVLASIGGIIFIVCIIVALVRCHQQRQAVQEQEQQQQPEVTYPQPVPPYNSNGPVQPYGMPLYGNGGPMVMPDTTPQPAIMPLGMDNGNPFAPPPPMQQPGNYVYGTPMGVPPSQYANDYGNGMYYSRGTEAQVAAAAPPQRTSSTHSSKSDTAVTYFENKN